MKKQVISYDTPFNDGKKVLVISGVHGDESNAVLVTREYARYVSGNIGEFKGVSQIEFVIGLNETGLVKHKREYQEITNPKPCDDLNRCFIASEPSSKKEDIIKFISDEIEKFDVVIDVHNTENLVNCTLIRHDAYAKCYLDILNKIGLQSVIVPFNDNTIKSYATSKGKLGFTVELNGMGFVGVSEFGENIRYLDKFIKGIGNIEIDHPIKDKLLDLDYVLVPVKSHTEGFFSFSTKYKNLLGEYKKGETIATVEDFNGNVIETIKAPTDGVIIDYYSTYIATENYVLADFAPIVREVQN